jgi:hypothetical protein
MFGEISHGTKLKDQEMKNICLALALAGGVVVPQIGHAQYADAVISYTPGTGEGTSYENSTAALGAPALGGSVTPFEPPYQASQIVGIGAGGEITLQMSSPIVNNPADPYGINFNVFANQFFIEGSGGVVSGLYDHPVSMTVKVSSDGSTWYTLNPALAPQANTLFPTAGSGNPQIAVNPSLTLANFTGQSLAGITSLYAGSAGGTGYDLSWAQDANGNSVDLTSVNYVQFDVSSGFFYLDAVSDVTPVPEPSYGWGSAVAAAGLLLVRFKSKRRLVAA